MKIVKSHLTNVICLENESCMQWDFTSKSKSITWPISKGVLYNVLNERHLSTAGFNSKTEYLIMDDKKETHWYSSKLFRELTKAESREYKIEKVLIGFH